ncbi:transposase [Massilia sp. NR 4-1]|uniref:transposase n=1 Tax=Massilia sp. NR 4-1 TaxID=1678028 RepID=UPI0006A2ABC2|nr:transposase [Massilia sp. NR 4-1]AKU20517.1 hypothetical protein ACZ75_02270 [Massilia sp. NR 4-1]
MSRHARIEFPGALYHVTARGVRRSHIFVDERDYLKWQALLAETVERFNLVVHAFCQMPNHYHLLVETPDGNLAAAIHFLNGVYAQHFNRRQDLVGHMVQGRYHAVLLQKQAHLLELARYISLNPVRACLVDHPRNWRWSSHRAMLDSGTRPSWLNTEWLLGQFAGKEQGSAARLYEEFVVAGIKRRDLPPGLNKIESRRTKCNALTLSEYASRHSHRDQALIAAYQSGAYRMNELSQYFGICEKTVSRLLSGSFKRTDS